MEINFESAGATLWGSYDIAGPETPSGMCCILLTGDGPRGSQSSTWSPLIAAVHATGSDTFIFDFLSQGRSSGIRTDLSLSVGVQNLRDAITYLKPMVAKGTRLSVVASSFGASVALAGWEYLSEAAVCMVLKSPASFLAESYETEHTHDEMIEWRNLGISAQTGLSYRAYVDALGYNLYQNASTVQCPVLTIHGTNDRIVPIAQTHRLMRVLNEYSEMAELLGVDHGYKEPGAQDELLSRTSAFIQHHRNRRT